MKLGESKETHVKKLYSAPSTGASLGLPLQILTLRKNSEDNKK